MIILASILYHISFSLVQTHLSVDDPLRESNIIDEIEARTPQQLLLVLDNIFNVSKRYVTNKRIGGSDDS
jgi:hypothetical protein